MVRGPAKREIKQERAARTREEILEAAIILFARRGFLATTMAELAKAIRMTPGALYWHFPTKEDLLLAAMEELHRRFMCEFTDLLNEHTRQLTVREQLLAFFNRAQNFLRYHREYGIFFGMVAAESAESNERVAGALREAVQVYAAVLAQMLRSGQQRGEFRADVDPMLVAHGLLAAYMGLLLHQHLFRDSLPYDPLVATLDRLVMSGMDASCASAPAPVAAPVPSDAARPALGPVDTAPALPGVGESQPG